jgi:hypothetical protein
MEPRFVAGDLIQYRGETFIIRYSYFEYEFGVEYYKVVNLTNNVYTPELDMYLVKTIDRLAKKIG